jgi:hypothetical protein
MIDGVDHGSIRGNAIETSELDAREEYPQDDAEDPANYASHVEVALLLMAMAGKLSIDALGVF